MILQTRSEKAFQWCNNLFQVLLSFVFLYPFWYVIVISLNDGNDSIRGGIYWWPRIFTFDNFRYLFIGDELVTAFGVSVARTVLGTLLSLVITAMVAFAASRPELPWRRLFHLILVIPMYFGGGLIAYYLLLRDINLVDTFWVYVFPFLFVTYYMILVRTAFRGLHDSLVESAQIDGASYFQILFRIAIPLAAPTLAAVALFTAVGHWNDWFFGAYFVNNPKMLPLQTYLNTMLSSVTLSRGTTSSAMVSANMKSQITPVSLRMACLVMVVAPILVTYPFLQRYFVSGVMIGSIRE